MSIKKSLRFEVFKRDSFTCQYCGRSTPEVVLHVDHIIPQSEGGIDDFGNLITACVDCNLGKGKIPLNESRYRNSGNQELLGDKIEQIELYAQYMKDLMVSREKISEMLFDYYVERINQTLYVSYANTLKYFLTQLPYNEIIEAIDYTASKNMGSASRAFKYLCGICWRKIKERKSRN